MLSMPDSLLTSLALGAVLVTAAWLYDLSRLSRAMFVALWLAVVVGLDVSDLEASRIASVEPSASRPLLERTDGYVTSQACQTCHPSQHASWEQSYHSKMTALPSEETVLAPFEGTVLSYRYSYFPHRRGDEFWISTDDPTWAEPGEALPVSRRVALVTGSHHQQLYWFERPGTRAVGRFHYFYRIPEQRWVPFKSAVLSKQDMFDDPGEFWTTVCIRCHSTHGKPRFEREAIRDADTRVAELGIACESCHGPGLEHTEANRNTLRRYLRYLLGGPDDTIVNPARLSADRSLDVCGQCHAVQSLGSSARIQQWSRNGMPYRPGDDIAKTRHIVDARPGVPDNRFLNRTLRRDPHFLEDRFWPDGVANVSGREYQGVKDSPCYASGEFTCLSCHVMHRPSDDPRSPLEWANDQLAADRQGNDACLGCHPEFAEPAAIEAHSHHASDSPGSSCYNCHMANTAYGLLNATRSHFIENPDTATQLATGRPNACNLCHLDQTLSWTARKLEEWYGTPAPEFLDPEHQRTAEGPLQALRGDAGQRALLAFHLGWEPAQQASGVEDWAVPMLGELVNDPYEAVRVIAHRSLATLPGYEDNEFDYLAPRAERRQARAELLDSWARSGAERSSPARLARVLIDDEGRRMQARVAQLLDQRDTRRVFRAE